MKNAISFVLFVILLVACSPGPAEVVAEEPQVQEPVEAPATAAPTLTSAPTPEPTNTSEPTATPEPEIGTFANPYPFSFETSYTVSYEDRSSNLEIEFTVQVLEILWGDECWLAVQASNMFNDPADEGQEYLCLRVAITNTGSNPVESISAYDFASVSDGTLFDWASVVDPKPELDISGLFPGGSGEGWITLTIKAGDTDPLFAVTDDPIEDNSLVQLIRP